MNLLSKTLVVMIISAWSSVFAASQSLIEHELVLGIGQSKRIQGTTLTIRFEGVLEDSRCPINAFCSMQGNGQVALEVLNNDEQIQTVTLNTTEEPKSTTTTGYRLTLIALKPSRVEGKPIANGDYSIILHIEPLNAK